MSNLLFDKFTEAYLECALWSSTAYIDGEDEWMDDYCFLDLSDETIKLAVQDCAAFQELHAADLEEHGFGDVCNGHDFWLTRVGHGAGFWDRGTGAVGDRLTTASEKFGEHTLYLGDDGKIYGM
jgi:hypothetical protein